MEFGLHRAGAAQDETRAIGDAACVGGEIFERPALIAMFVSVDESGQIALPMHARFRRQSIAHAHGCVRMRSSRQFVLEPIAFETALPPIRRYRRLRVFDDPLGFHRSASWTEPPLTDALMGFAFVDHPTRVGKGEVPRFDPPVLARHRQIQKRRGGSAQHRNLVQHAMAQRRQQLPRSAGEPRLLGDELGPDPFLPPQQAIFLTAQDEPEITLVA
ncbi:hypothetical protein [Lysobacter sp. CA199]|uniref:hypothetical protein n=1 Tax=Lysobacter sp. CA199 TaxID=3455608 RepID=UPI003F8D3610